MKKMARVECRVHQDLADALEAKAEQLQVNKSEYVRIVLTEALMG